MSKMHVLECIALPAAIDMFSSLQHSPAPNGGASFVVGRDAFGNYTTQPKSTYVPQLQSMPGYFIDFGNAKARSEMVFTSTDIFIISHGILLHATSNGTGSKVGATRIAKQLWFYGRTLYTR